MTNTRPVDVAEEGTELVLKPPLVSPRGAGGIEKVWWRWTRAPASTLAHIC